MEGIAAAQEALELLIPAGDFAGALDVLSDLTAAGTPMHVVGLHAFRDLPQQLAGAEEVWPTLGPFVHRDLCGTKRESIYCSMLGFYEHGRSVLCRQSIR